MYFSFFFLQSKIFYLTSKFVETTTDRNYLPQKYQKNKRKHAAIFYALTGIIWIAVAGKPALLHSLSVLRTTFVKIIVITRKTLDFRDNLLWIASLSLATTFLKPWYVP